MKKLLVFIFLLTLFLIPIHPAAAAYGDISPSSITSFAETSENNQMIFLGSNGWQHDCSTTANVSSVGTGKVTLSSDGDVLRIQNTESGSPNAASFWINQSSQETIDMDNFLFLSINITAVQAGGEWSMSLYNNSTLTSIQTATSSTGVFRYNIKVGYSPNDPNQVYLYAGGIVANNKWIDVSWVKIYSIANFTVLGNSLEKDDILYVDSSDALVSPHLDGGGEYFAIYNTVALNVATSLYDTWNLTITGTYNPAGTDFAFRPYIDASLRTFYYDSTRGTYLTTAELDNFYLYIYEILAVHAIKFIDTHYWHEVNELPIYFVVPISAASIWALNGWYMLLGAGMVIFSTCFAAIKIKSRSGNIDDILIFFVLFILGWGLVLTGALS